jgi:hypothetical protein
MKPYQLHARSLLRSGCHSIDIQFYDQLYESFLQLSKGGQVLGS